MANIQTAIARMIYWCQDVSLGYDQSNRLDFRNGGETDCSALVIHVLKEAEFDTGAASFTGNMRSELTKHDWQVVPNNGNPQAGDVLLHDTQHAALFLGNGQLGQASIDERGKATGGQGGDQTGHETNLSSYYNYPWSCYLRYTGSQTTPEKEGKLKVDGVLGFLTVSALQRALGTPVDGVISKPVSSMVQALQRFLNSKGAQLAVDGSWGAKTTRALQAYLGTPQDGVLPASVIKALQTRLNTGEL